MQLLNVRQLSKGNLNWCMCTQQTMSFAAFNNEIFNFIFQIKIRLTLSPVRLVFVPCNHGLACFGIIKSLQLGFVLTRLNCDTK